MPETVRAGDEKKKSCDCVKAKPHPTKRNYRWVGGRHTLRYPDIVQDAAPHVHVDLRASHPLGHHILSSVLSRHDLGMLYFNKM